MQSSLEFYFTSTLFDVEPGEDLESNPGIYGKNLSEWLRQGFADQGYSEADAYPDDWGWRVDCQRSPFTLFVGCGAFVKTGAYDSSKPVPNHEDLLWYVFPSAQAPLLRRLRGNVDIEPAYEELRSQIERILLDESGIELVDKPDRGEWELPPPSAAFQETTGPVLRKPLSAWLSIPLGLLTLLGLPFMYIAMLEILADPPAGREVGVISLSLIVLIPMIWMVKLAGQLLLPRLDSFRGLTTPNMLRIIALAVLVLPLWTIKSGYHSTYPLDFAIQIVGHVLAFAFLWWRAKARTERDKALSGDDNC